MKNFLLCFLLLFVCSNAYSGTDSAVVMFWNLENFFEPGDTAASPYWTARRFRAKCNGIAKTILEAADHAGKLPDAIGFAEVGNAAVLRRLINGTILGKTDYRIVHYDSPRPEGDRLRAALPQHQTQPQKQQRGAPEGPRRRNGCNEGHPGLRLRFAGPAGEPSPLETGKRSRRPQGCSNVPDAASWGFAGRGGDTVALRGGFQRHPLGEGPPGHHQVQRGLGEDRRRLRIRGPAVPGRGFLFPFPAGAGPQPRRPQTAPNLQRAEIYWRNK